MKKYTQKYDFAKEEISSWSVLEEYNAPVN